MNKKEMNNKGFSLVELIIVIAIMAILVGVLAPQFIKYVERSRVSTDIQNVQQLKTAIEVYIADTNNPAPTADITITFTPGAVGTAKAEVTAGWATIPDFSGASKTIMFKSGNWTGTGVTATYSCTGSTPTYKWTTTSFTNNGTDMKTVFD